MQLEQTQPLWHFGIKYPQVSPLSPHWTGFSLMQKRENHHIRWLSFPPLALIFSSLILHWLFLFCSPLFCSAAVQHERPIRWSVTSRDGSYTEYRCEGRKEGKLDRNAGAILNAKFNRLEYYTRKKPYTRFSMTTCGKISQISFLWRLGMKHMSAFKCTLQATLKRKKTEKRLSGCIGLLIYVIPCCISYFRIGLMSVFGLCPVQ